MTINGQSFKPRIICNLTKFMLPPLKCCNDRNRLFVNHCYCNYKMHISYGHKTKEAVPLQMPISSVGQKLLYYFKNNLSNETDYGLESDNTTLPSSVMQSSL